MMRSLAVLLAATTLGAWQQPSRDLRLQVRALADSGKLDEAERRGAERTDKYWQWFDNSGDTPVLWIRLM